jgi:glycine cleavage system aminomethyltransferase T
LVGCSRGIADAGLNALETLRLDKAYRDYCHDIDNMDTPLEAGLGPVANEGGVTPDFVKSGTYEIDVSGKRYPARASLRPMYDPKGIKIRS